MMCDRCLCAIHGTVYYFGTRGPLCRDCYGVMDKVAKRKLEVKGWFRWFWAALKGGR
jgi:hypothetical protein